MNAALDKPAQAGGPTRSPPRLNLLATDPNIDAAKLQQLIEAGERSQSRRAELAFARALTALAPELPIIAENGALLHGGEVVATYPLWEDIAEAIRPILNRHGFSLGFRTRVVDQNWIEVSAVLRHRRGHSEETSLRLPPDASGDKNNVQAIGSAVSYGKRYTACAMLNIVTRGADDDGRAAGGLVTPAQVMEIEARLIEVGADRQRLLRYIKAPDIASIAAAQFGAAMAALEAKSGMGRGR